MEKQKIKETKAKLTKLQKEKISKMNSIADIFDFFSQMMASNKSFSHDRHFVLLYSAFSAYFLLAGEKVDENSTYNDHLDLSITLSLNDILSYLGMDIVNIDNIGQA